MQKCIPNIGRYYEYRKTFRRIKNYPAEVFAPAGAYAKAVILDGYAHLSGQGPRDNDGKPLTGQVPTDLSVDEAILAARNVGHTL